MRRALALFAATAFATAAFAYDPAIRDIDISVRLDPDGSALITEVWDVTVASGTEWYLVRDNLDGMQVSGLSVVDETGAKYLNEGSWDVDRSIECKAGRCGIVSKRGGCEICWGVGSYGPHKYTVGYRLSGAVRSMDDYDCLHLQLITPGLSSRPQHARVSISAAGKRLDTSSVRAWGFGYDGTVTFTDAGTVVFESTERFSSGSSVIALLRFDKGIFSPVLNDGGQFSDVLEAALEGADFGDESSETTNWDEILETALLNLLIFICSVVIPVWAMLREKGWVSRRKKKQILGCKPSEVTWFRDPPFGGDLAATEAMMKKLGEQKKSNTMAAALILRMIYSGVLSVGKDSKGKVEISFGDASRLDSMPAEERTLYDMMLEASGKDSILQRKEFSRWAVAHKSRVCSWVSAYEARGKEAIKQAGSAEARQSYGFRKFLQDFTLVKDKAAIEVHMWQEYLVFASLFGIADKVAEELKDIDTSVASQVIPGGTSYSLPDVIYMTDTLARAISNARNLQASTAGRSSGMGGFGGGASFGGGGGFHGGGFGGGSR